MTIAEVLTLLSIIISLAGISGTIIWNLWRKIIKNSEELHAFQLKVSEECVKKEDLRQVFQQEAQDG